MEIPELGPDAVGGQDANLRMLQRKVVMPAAHPELARRYRSLRRAVLLEGPPGCGKTLLARVVASLITRLTGRNCRFVLVKPAELESEFVGVTERNIREFFAACAKAAEEGPVVIFLDEIEATGRARGQRLQSVQRQGLGIVPSGVGRLSE